MMTLLTSVLEWADCVVRYVTIGVLLVLLTLTLAIWWSMRRVSIALIALIVSLLSEQGKADVLHMMGEKE
jgi:hypothetical protein